MNNDLDKKYGFWVNTALALKRKVLFARALQTFLPFFFWLSVPIAAGILICRNFSWPIWWCWPILGVFAFTVGIWSWWRAWIYRYTTKDALVHLENALELKSSLSGAAEGISPWPEPLPTKSVTPRWRYSKLVFEPLLMIFLFLFAFLCPLPPQLNADFGFREPPPALRIASSLVEEVEQESLVEPAVLEDIKKQISDILRQPESKWYEHTSLEAADNLRNTLQSGIGELRSALETAQTALENVAQFSNLSESQLRDLQKSLSEAAETLESGALPLNSTLAQKLGGLQLQHIQNLTEEQKMELIDRLREASKACRASSTCSSNGQSCNSGEEDENSVSSQNAQVRSSESQTLLVDNTLGNSSDSATGTGSVQRGGGPQAPLAYNVFHTDLATEKIEALPPPDIKRAGLGDLLNLTARAPSVEDFASKSTAGTARVESRGLGSTYNENFTPEERQALENFYK